MSKYQEYKQDALRFEKFLLQLGTHNAFTIDLSPTRRLRAIRRDASREMAVTVETYVNGTGWLPEAL